MPSLLFQQTKDLTRWITDDRFLGQWYLSDAEGVNIRRASRGVVLANNTRTSYTQLDTWDNQIYAFFEGRFAFDDYRTIAVWTNKIYDTTTATTFTGPTNMRNGWIVKSAGVNYGVIFTQGLVRRWDNDSSTPASAASLFSLSSTSDYRPFLYDGWFIYAGWDGTVDAIDVSTSTWVITKTLNVSWSVRAITKIGDQIYVYTNDGTNWYKNSWDWVTIYPLYIQKWADNPVLNVANIGNTDYVVTGTWNSNGNKLSRFFLSQWWDKKLLYWGDFINYTKQLFNFSPTYTNAIETINNTVLIASVDHIYGYGNIKASLPQSLVKDYVINDTLEAITALYVKDQYTLYIAYKTDDVTPQISFEIQDIRDGYAYGDSWYVTTLAYDWWDIETEKINNRIIVNAQLASKTSSPVGTTSIDIYTRVNNTDERVFDISWFTEAPVTGSTYLHQWLIYTVKEFTDNDELICTRTESWPQYDDIMYGTSITTGVLTKIDGPWDATLGFDNVDNFVFLKTITDTTKRKHRIEFKRAWYELEIKAVLRSTQKSISPELFSIKTLFDYKDKDDG